MAAGPALIVFDPPGGPALPLKVPLDGEAVIVHRSDRLPASLGLGVLVTSFAVVGAGASLLGDTSRDSIGSVFGAVGIASGIVGAIVGAAVILRDQAEPRESLTEKPLTVIGGPGSIGVQF